ncbi:MAG: helix-turn-helix domain-containing protein [Patescibacteria group bacterium]
MIRYPIVVRKIPSGCRISFPDLSTYVEFTPKDGGPPTEDAYRQAISQAAANYLSATSDRKPGWIPARLRDTNVYRDGYQIVRPGTVGEIVLRDPEIALEVELPPNIEEALKFHWLRQDMGKSREEMSRLLNIDPERYVKIEECRIRPNHHERARLRNFQQRSQRFSIRQAEEPAAVGGTRLAAS